MGGGDSGFDQKMDVNEAETLKYLGFIHSAALCATLCFSNLYVRAKDKSGPLKPGVESVEGAVKTIFVPVYHKFHDVPIELVKFVDRKMDESMSDLHRRIPPGLKQIPKHAKNVYSNYEPAAKEVYSKYEPVAEQYAVRAWQSLNQLPLFPHVAERVASCSKKYNQTVRLRAEEGYRYANYMPLIPTEKIAMVFAADKRETDTEIEVS